MSNRKGENLRNPLPSEEIHLPGPHPARGIYGFALYIVSWCCLILYLLWAIVPTPLLKRAGITYVPAKYWAIAFPAALLLFVCSYVTIIFFINLIRFGGYSIFNNVEVVEHDFGDKVDPNLKTTSEKCGN